MLRLLSRYWFLLGLLILIPGGFFAGARIPEEDILGFNAAAGKAMSRGLTGAVLFLMSISLNTGRLTAAVRAPRPVLWASLVNAAVIPLLACPLVAWQHIPDFAVGLMIAASVPCTMAAASVWTRSAGGNDAVALLVTMLTNSLCFLVIPFWMALGAGTSVDLSASAMVLPLLIGAFTPIAVGQLVRLPRRVGGWADARTRMLTNLAQTCMLGQVVWACVTAGPAMRDGIAAEGGWRPAGQVWACCVALHLAGMLIAWWGAPILGIGREDRIATAFAGSQKTLPIGILIATTPQMLGGERLAFAIFPVLMFHASQLVIDTVIAAAMKSGGPLRVPGPADNRPS